MNGEFEGIKLAFYMTTFFVIAGIVMSIGKIIADWLSDKLELKDWEKEKSEKFIQEMIEEEKKLDNKNSRN